VKTFRSLAPLAAAFFAAALVACSSTGGTKSAPASDAKNSAKSASKAALAAAPEERARQRWQHIIDGHAELAYDYMTPGARSAKSREAWTKEMSERPVRWTKAEYLDKFCESDDACQIRLQVEFKAPLQGAPGGLMSAPGTLTEHWIRVDGIWYFLPDTFVSGGLH